jgi:hypothetical protein
MQHSVRMSTFCVIGGLLAAGCYSYRPLATTNPEPGTSLGVTLTDAGSVELGRYLGSDTFIVRGRLVRADEGGLVLAVASVETKRGDWNPWSGETVTLPASTIASVEVRQFAKGRTMLLAGVGVAGLAATTLAFTLTGGGTAAGVGPGPSPK